MVVNRAGIMKSGAVTLMRLKTDLLHNSSIFSCSSINVIAVAGSLSSICQNKNENLSTHKNLKSKIISTHFYERNAQILESIGEFLELVDNMWKYGKLSHS